MADNVLYYGDNLDVLRHHVRDETVDLVYLDPPFNSNASYNVLFSAQAGDGKWLLPAAGTALDAVTTAATVLHILREATSMANAMKHAVGLDGDTDTGRPSLDGSLAASQKPSNAEYHGCPKSPCLTQSRSRKRRPAYIASGDH